MLAKAKAAQSYFACVTGDQRNRTLLAMGTAIRDNVSAILDANRDDVSRASDEGLSGAMLARLQLSTAKLEQLAGGLVMVSQLADPIGRGEGLRQLNNGLKLEQVRVPLGVIGLIFESRPGVVVEAGGLTVKSGNAIILRGGHEAFQTNRILADMWRTVLQSLDLPADVVQMVNHTGREYVHGMMHLKGLDLLIPRGGAGLIQTVIQDATVPVIETGVGNCHLFVDRACNMDMAISILRDGKVGNPAVCNALETVLVHEQVAHEFYTRARKVLKEDGVVWHGDDSVCQWIPEAMKATEEDWKTEYLSLDIAAKVVADVHAALAHIADFGTGHSEAIVTNDYLTGQLFLDKVDAAAVYWNASTRFTDGFEYGLGAEVGISTQKLHARGPMGLTALTTIKTIAWGTGQTRDM